jgi:type VI secretion system protein VasG
MGAMALVVDHKAILKRLTRPCMAALERGVGRVVAARQYEVTSEHVLLALLEDPSSDLAFLVRFLGLDGARLSQIATREVEQMRSGHAGKPVFTPYLLEWMQDAATVGSIEHGYQKIRSGVLLLMLVRRAAAYTTAPVSNVLGAVRREELEAHLPRFLSRSMVFASVEDWRTYTASHPAADRGAEDD